MYPIQSIHAREVFDSRGRPTVEVEVACESCPPGRAIVPSGMSTGRFEAAELRDGDPSRLDGLGVTRAVENVRGDIARHLKGMDADDQQAIDRALCDLDGTPDKSRLGANAILGVSLSTARAAASAKHISLCEQLTGIWNRVPSTSSGKQPARSAYLGQPGLLPLPMINMISGGLHAGHQLQVQDFLIMPVGATCYRQAFEWAVMVHRQLGRLLRKQGYEAHLGADEGGYGPKLRDNVQAIELLVEAIGASGLRPGEDVVLGLDVAASHFASDGIYSLDAAEHRHLTAAKMVELLADWVDRFPIISIEDGLAEDDSDGWQILSQRLGKRIQIIGDDLFVTSRARLQQGIREGLANSVLIKVNQVGTLWETLETVRLALDFNYWPVVSARSGDTEDPFIADLAVAIGAGQIKIGSVTRSERLAKYNQLLRLEERLGPDARYLGGSIFDSLSGSPRNGSNG